MFASLHTSTLTVRHVQTRGSVTDFAAHLRAGLTVWRQRQQLLRLDATRLADIGLTADEAADEAARSLWDVPTNWRRAV